MDVYVLLDVLLIILVALFIPIGFWRGAYREAFVTLGILFGASLGTFWGETWGAELASATRLHESGGAFMVAMLCLISATFLLGYSSGAAIPVPDPGWVARLLGALIAGANGALLLSFALRDIRVYLLSSEEAGFLDNAIIAPFLSEGTGWILLVAAAVFVPITLVLALFAPGFEEDDYYDDDEYEMYEGPYEDDPYPQRTMNLGRHAPAFTQRRPQPAPRPAPSPAPAEETRPIPAPPTSEPTPESESDPAPRVSQDTPPPDAVETRRRERGIEETQPYRPPPASQQRAEGPGPGAASFSSATSGEETTDEQQVVFGHRPWAGMEVAQASAASEHQCSNCQADISNATGFCPRCGERI